MSIGAPFQIFGTIVHHRGLLRQMVIRDLSARFIGTSLGAAWSLLQPLILLGLYTFVFGVIYQVRFQVAEGVGFVPFLFCGMWPWMAFQDACQRSVTVIVDNAQLMKRVQFRSRWATTGLVTLGLAIVSANLGLDYRYHRLLAETGGRGIWSDAIYDLTGYLQQRCPTQRCFIGDWGLGTQVLTLAGGQLAIEEMFWPYINTAASPPQQQRRNSARAMAGIAPEQWPEQGPE